MTQSISRPCNTPISPPSAAAAGLAGWSLKSVPGFSAAADTPLLNGKLAHAFEAHYDKEFPIKRLGTNLWAALDYTLFHEGRPGVVIGKDGWLFTDEEFKPAPSGQQLEDNWALVRGVQRELNRRGVKLVLAVIPAKARLYPEHIGREQPAALHDSLYQDFLARARAAGIDSPDLLGSLRQARTTARCSCAPTPTGRRSARKPWPSASARRSARRTCWMCRRRTSSPASAKNARTRATCSASCRSTRCSTNCCRVRSSCSNAPPKPRRHCRAASSPARATTSSAIASNRAWRWSAPATAPTPGGTSRAR